jgi:hypothetical protein
MIVIVHPLRSEDSASRLTERVAANRIASRLTFFRSDTSMIVIVYPLRSEDSASRLTERVAANLFS